MSIIFFVFRQKLVWEDRQCYGYCFLIVVAVMRIFIVSGCCCCNTNVYLCCCNTSYCYCCNSNYYGFRRQRNTGFVVQILFMSTLSYMPLLFLFVVDCCCIPAVVEQTVDNTTPTNIQIYLNNSFEAILKCEPVSDKLLKKVLKFL